MPLTTFVGREHEAALAVSLLRRDDIRLLTLTGPGGVGKTRLAIRVAQDLAEAFGVGVQFVPLAPVQDAELVAATVARALGLLDMRDTTARGALVETLRGSELLLVLDNFEHVLAAAPFLTDLLTGCRGVKILVTSRTLLRLSGEQALPVPPLDLPTPEAVQSLTALSRSPAVQLFVSRAQAATPAFRLTDDTAPAVAEICRLLDGLPLAIELAAAQSTILPPAPLLARIRARLPLPFKGPRDAPVRLRTVRDTVAWSHDLLSAEQQRLFRSLGVFVGGFGLDAVEYVNRSLSGDSEPHVDDLDHASLLDPADRAFDRLAALVDKSLLQQAPWEHEPRFSMLETFRGFALEQLLRLGEDDIVRSAHADWCLHLAEESSLATLRPGGHQELRRLEVEHANLRAALDWLERRGDRDRLLRLSASLGRFWYALGHFEEGRHRLERALSATAGTASLARSQALIALDMLRYVQGEPSQGEHLIGESIQVLREHGDTVELISALNWNGWTAVHHGDYDKAELLLWEALGLAATIPEPLIAQSAKGKALANLGVVAHERRDLETARTRHQEALRIRRDLGDILGTSHSLCDLGSIAADQTRYVEAISCFRECLALLGEQGYPLVVVNALVGSASVAAAWGQPDRAARLLGAAEAEREQFRVGVDLPTERAAHSRSASAVRAALGDQGLRTEWLAGRELLLADVIAEVHAMEPPIDTPDPSIPPPAIRLSPREVEVLRLLSAGQSDRQVAATLFISPRTAEGHVARLLAKLGVSTRAAAVDAAVAAGLTTPRVAGSPPHE